MYNSLKPSQVVKVVKGNSVTWGLCSRTIRLDKPRVLAYGNNTIAVGLVSFSDNIIILDATTGSQVAVLSSHTNDVTSLVFSSDGRLLVSGSCDMTVKLWDVQTGGVVKTFCGHAGRVSSVSISADCTRIASGSWDCKICVWDIKTGECHCTITMDLGNPIDYVGFFPANSTSLMSISRNTVQQWDTNGHQIGSTYNASYVAFTSEHTQLVLCNESVVIVQNSDSGVPTAELHLPKDSWAEHCCFSPHGNLVAVSSHEYINVWNIANLVPNLVGTFAPHHERITAVVFSHHFLISASLDSSVKFWQVGISSIDQAATDLESNSSHLDGVQFVSLQVKNGIALTGDFYGTVIIWDILTGLYKKSFQTPAKLASYGDAQLMDDRLLLVWGNLYGIYTWDSREGQHPLKFDPNSTSVCGVRISGDWSKVFCLVMKENTTIIQAWAMWTWELVGKVKVGAEVGMALDHFHAGGSRIWIQFENSQIKGWDFDVPGSSPVPVSNIMSERPHLDLIGATWHDSLYFIKNTVTGKEVFRLSGKYSHPYCASWDGQYLVAGYQDGELLILDFENLCS